RKKEVNGSSSAVVGQRYLLKKGDDLPASVHWREKGAVAPVKVKDSVHKAKRAYAILRGSS
ncbi:hypothetical protein LINPERPRIM_LOCUS16891, partial [Linum perenne]